MYSCNQKINCRKSVAKRIWSVSVTFDNCEIFSKMMIVRKLLTFPVKRHLVTVPVKNASFASAKTTTDGRFIEIAVDRNDANVQRNEQLLKYPLIWLRDNCQCSNCFHAQTKSRTIDWTEFDFKNAQPKTVSVRKISISEILRTHYITKKKSDFDCYLF